MKWLSTLLGAAGFALSVAVCMTWIADPDQLSWQMMGLIGVSALGGLIAVRFPGLHALPSSLPVVGAMAVTSGAPAAVVAGFAAGMATSLAPAPAGAPAEIGRAARLHSAWTVGGAIALGAGLAANGYARITFAPIFGAAPPFGTPEEAMRVALFLLSLLFLCWLISGALRRQSRLAETAQRRARTGIALVESIALAIEAKDRTSERHLRRMRCYAVGVGRHLGMSAADLETLEYAALLHDIGKLVVPESILSKPSGLSREEFQTMSTHARVGAEILRSTALPAGVAAMVRHHHERYDGSGYPDGLTGMEIPLGARILAAVDTFEALTSARPYRPRMTAAQAIDFLQRHAGSSFDPRAVSVLVDHHAEFEDQMLAEEQACAARDKDAPQSEGQRGGPPFQRVLDRIASSHMEVYSLHEIAQALGKTLSLEESFALIVGRIQRLIHFSSCAIYLFDHEKEALVPRYASGAGAARICGLTIPLGQKVSGWAALQRRPATLQRGAGAADWDLEEIAGEDEIAGLGACLAAPLLVEEGLVGVITLYDEADRGYSPQEEHLLSLVARQVGGAIRTGLLFEQSQQHALTDSLTGLPNTRYMFIVFDQESARAREQGSPLTLMMLDIDNFREINDDFGHHAGDRFLIGMAKAIRSQMRICDTCIRYAGDQFVAIMPGLAGAEVDAVAERLTEAARDYCMEGQPGRPVRLGLSIGYASMPADGEDFESLIAAAEARMKAQKARHRKRDDEPLAVVPFGALAGPRRH